MSSSVLDDCPQVRTFLCCIPLRVGCIYVGLAGIVMGAWGAMCIALTMMDKSHLESVGLGSEIGKLAMILFGILNLLLLVASVVLIVGACLQNNFLVTIYCWFILIYIIALIVTAIIVLVSAALADNIQSLVMFLLTGILIIIVVSHFFLVANSYRMQT